MHQRPVISTVIILLLLFSTPKALKNIMAGPDDLYATDTSSGTAEITTNRLQPADFTYLGAFRLPNGGARPKTFAYGGNAVTFNPAGDKSGPKDGFPGSLFITGHDRLPYGELPDVGKIEEVNIPIPVISKRPSQLKRASFLQNFTNVLGGRFTNMEEIPHVGMQYLDTAATGPKIHFGWGQHLESDPQVPTYVWFSPTLNTPNVKGTWFVGKQLYYGLNDYLFEIPKSWADKNVNGRYLATGRVRDGGWAGMGPVIYAYRPWTDENGTPAKSGTHLTESVLLRYQDSTESDEIANCMKGYQHPDEWEGGEWLTTRTGKSAVLFAGTKSTGSKYWYGYYHATDPKIPCVEVEMIGQFTLCRLANGQPCPEEDLHGCVNQNQFRGWWSTRFDGQFILYDPADLAKVAAKKLAPWKPQPYATIDIDEHLLLNPSHVEEEMIGRGVQRKHRIGGTAYDRKNDLLYVLEWYADGIKPVIHVWKVR